MDKATRVGSFYGYLLAVFLLTFSFIELTSGPVILGKMTTNPAYTATHATLGMLGLGMLATGLFRPFISLVAVFLSVVGVLHFISGTDVLLWRIFHVNNNVAYMNFVIGGISFFMLSVTSTQVHEHHQPVNTKNTTAGIH